MVVIRLSRGGAKKRPFYHISVSDKRNKRDGSFIEKIGFYNPIAKDGEEKIKVNLERYEYWLSVGAQPSDTVEMLVKRSGMSAEEIEKIENKKKEQQRLKKEKEILAAQEKAAAERAKDRKEQVGSGERSDKIRTYNYKDNRVSDHRINLTIKKLDQVLDGDLDEFVEALVSDHEASRLANLED